MQKSSCVQGKFMRVVSGAPQEFRFISNLNLLYSTVLGNNSAVFSVTKHISLTPFQIFITFQIVK